MTPAEHFRAAERLLVEVASIEPGDIDAAMLLLGRAEIHATLATVPHAEWTRTGPVPGREPRPVDGLLGHRGGAL